MGSGDRFVRAALIAMAWWGVPPSTADAQECLLVICDDSGPCTYQRVYSPTLNGKDSVRLLPSSAPEGAPPAGKGRSVKLSSVGGLYRDPRTGFLRLLARNGELGDLVMPAKLPEGAAAGPAASARWTLEYREQPKSKTRVSLTMDRLAAVLREPPLDSAVVDFVRREVAAPAPHPLQARLVAGAVAFAEGSEPLRQWRDALRSTMRTSLDRFRAADVDPTRIETTLAGGVTAARILAMVDPRGQPDALQAELADEHRRLLQRFAIAGVFRSAGMHDAFLEKIDQVGLARWSRPDLMAGIDKALEASAESHHRRAMDLHAAGQYGGAFDEARIASSRAPCDETIAGFYYTLRAEFVTRNTIPASPEYEGPHRTSLQQIVRELQGIAQETGLSPERIDVVRKRIAEGERLDKDYLPLQLKHAEFLAALNELAASREVVTRVVRSVTLSRSEAEEWLRMDATLNAKLLTLRQSTARQLDEQFAAGQFKEALATAANGLRAEPENPRFLHAAAVAAAVLRDQEQTRAFVRRYLALLGSDCTDGSARRSLLLELYGGSPSAAGFPRVIGGTPNWISGEPHLSGEASYDPISGSFNPRMRASLVAEGKSTTGTQFRWDGYLAASIQTTTGSPVGARHVLLDLEPVYDTKRLYMRAIGTTGTSEGQRRLMELRYLNSPDYDPILAAKVVGTGKPATRGWAGNPFFHPFLWDGIFMFDLVYDALGRLKEAIPVESDLSQRKSPYSEPLTFTWDGGSRRLLSIASRNYRRELTYDGKGRLASEKITHSAGRGKIEYQYDGDSPLLSGAVCEDDFYDKARRRVIIEAADR